MVSKDPTDDYKGKLQLILNKALDDKIISANEHRFMLPKDPQIPTFYSLPKIHKGLCQLKGRPIVSMG